MKVTQEWIDSLAREIESCTQVQNWQPNATRSRWVDDLIPLLEAAKGVLEFEALLDQAEEQQYLLTERVAKRLCEVDSLLDRVEDPLYTEAATHETLPELVKFLQRKGFTLIDESSGARDGYTLDGGTAVAYASCRGIADDDLNYVCIDLITSEIKRW